MLRATPFFRIDHGRTLAGDYRERSVVSVEDLIIWWENSEEMVGNLDSVLERS